MTDVVSDATTTTTSIGTYTIIALIIATVLMIGIGYAIYLHIKSQVPDISTRHKQNCAALQQQFDGMGIPENSALRKKYCDTTQNCALEFRPKSTEPVCPEGRVLNGSSSKTDPETGKLAPDPTYDLGPCCTFPALPQPEEKGVKDTIEDMLHSHPLMGSVVIFFIAKKIATFLTPSMIQKPIVRAGKAVGKGVGKLALAPVKGAGKYAAKKGSKLAAAIAEKTGGKIVAKKLTEIIEKIGETMLGKIVERIVTKLLAAAALAATGVGAILSSVMWMSQLLDMADVHGYHQFIHNRTYLDMRDASEGGFINRMKDMGLQPPFLFTLDQLAMNYSVLEKDAISPNGKKLSQIHAAYTKALASHIADVLEEAQNKLSEEDNDMIDEAAANIVHDKPFVIPDSLTTKLTEAFSEVPKTRDEGIWKHMKANLPSDLGKYVQIDSGLSSERVHAITLSFPDGYKLWNDFVESDKQGHLPMAVYSEYYRVIKSQRPGKNPDTVYKDTPRHQIRNKIERKMEETAGIGSLDMEGQTVYTIETKKLPRKWMQISFSKGLIHTKCKKGLHLPAIAQLLATLADQKVCISSGKEYKSGSCSHDEYSMNKLGCLSDGGEWSSPSCTGEEGSDTGSAVSGVIEHGLSHYTDTIHKGAVAMNAGDGEKAPETITSDNFSQDLGTAMDSISGDVFPKDFNVSYNDDTGICDFNDDSGESAWCERMGMDTLTNQKDAALYSDQSYTDCETDLLQDAAEMIIGETFTRDFIRFKHDADKVVDEITTGIGRGLQGTGIPFFDKAGGHGTGSLAYAVDGHAAERMATWTQSPTLEKAGKAFDDTYEKYKPWP